MVFALNNVNIPSYEEGERAPNEILPFKHEVWGDGCIRHLLLCGLLEGLHSPWENLAPSNLFHVLGCCASQDSPKDKHGNQDTLFAFLILG